MIKGKRWFDELGEIGLLDRFSAPRRSPTQTPDHVVELIETWRRERKWTARQVRRELIAHEHQVSVTTIGRWFVRLRINRRRDRDPSGAGN